MANILSRDQAREVELKHYSDVIKRAIIEAQGMIKSNVCRDCIRNEQCGGPCDGFEILVARQANMILDVIASQD